MGKSSFNNFGGAGGDFIHITSVTLEADTRLVTFEDLDINSDGMYIFDVLCNWDVETPATSSAFALWINDAVAGASIEVNTSSHSSGTGSGQTNWGRVDATAAGCFARILLTRNPVTSKAMYQSYQWLKEPGAQFYIYAGERGASVTNITKVEFDADASTVSDKFLSGSVFSLSKQKLVA